MRRGVGKGSSSSQAEWRLYEMKVGGRRQEAGKCWSALELC